MEKTENIKNQYIGVRKDIFGVQNKITVLQKCFEAMAEQTGGDLKITFHNSLAFFEGLESICGDIINNLSEIVPDIDEIEKMAESETD